MVATTPRRRSPRLAAAFDASSSSSDRNEKPKPVTSSSTKIKAKVPRVKPKPANERLPTVWNAKRTARSKPDAKELLQQLEKQNITKRTVVEEDAANDESKTTRRKVGSDILPRTRETQVKEAASTTTTTTTSHPSIIMGIDEAGRGPLAGPVVAAAVVVPFDIPGITDSKKITCEEAREELYKQIVTSTDVSWAVAVVDAKRIDEINILQATMQGMSMAASALIGCSSSTDDDQEEKEAENRWNEACRLPACASRKGCYVACGGAMLKPQSTAAGSDTGRKTTPNLENGQEEEDRVSSSPFYALVDGNRIPTDLPCPGESIVKGDSKEYSIAAASILAKVTRDRLMHSYDELYPEYKLGKHKGYPTKEHMAAVFELGASPIHRRTFAPLKHMKFDENGKIIVDESTD